MTFKEKRLQLQRILEGILGTKNVYYQAPINLKMRYPCIRYRLYGFNNTPADNISYVINHRFEVTLITKDPDTDLVDRLIGLPSCTHNRSFTSDNLYHHVFLLYY